MVLHLLPLSNPMANRRHVASLSLFYSSYFGRCSFERAKLVPLPYSRGRTTRYPVETGRKLNVHKTFRRRPERLLNVLCTFNLRPVSTGYCDGLCNLFVTICRYYKDVYVSSFFSRTARPWNYLPIEYSILNYDLNGFNKFNFITYDVATWQTNNCNVHIGQYPKKSLKINVRLGSNYACNTLISSSFQRELVNSCTKSIIDTNISVTLVRAGFIFRI